MQPPQQHSWNNNLAEIKGQLIKRLGFERSKQYLDYLNRFLSLKLSKAEFDKLCLRTVGKDNIRLHNQLIRAVLKSAIVLHDDSSRTVGNKKPSSDGIHHQNGSVPVATHVTSSLAFGNGDILPPSPRKARTGPRERRGGDRRSALGPNGNANYASFSSSGPQSAVPENGNSSSPDARRAVVHHQHEPVQGAENGGKSASPPEGFVGVHREEHTESLGRKDGKRVSDRISLHAPLGVPYCPVSIGGAHRALPLAASSSRCVGVLHTDGLLETTTLRERMEQISAAQGLQGVSMDCANVVNGGLDAYLKGLIGSCVKLNGARSVPEPTKSGFVKNPTHSRSLNGVTSHHQIQQNSGWPLNAMQEHEPKRLVTLLDFRVGMELNRKQLGEDWPILLEKICCTHAFEE